MGKALTSKQILLTNSLRKYMEISLENLYLDIGAESIAPTYFRGRLRVCICSSCEFQKLLLPDLPDLFLREKVLWSLINYHRSLVITKLWHFGRSLMKGMGGLTLGHSLVTYLLLRDHAFAV